MYRHILIYGVLLLLCACSGNPQNENDQKKVNRFTQLGADDRVSNNNLLILPNDPKSTFDIRYYQHLDDLVPELAIKNDFLRGGLLYDKWWTPRNGSIRTAPPVTSVVHLAWPKSINSDIDSTSTWRCAICHGWDYIGAEGVYSDPNTLNFSGISGIVQASPNSPAKLIDPGLIYEFIHSGQTASGIPHQFGLYISVADIYALTRFITTIQNQALNNLSPSSVIELASKKVIGNQSKGFVQYHNLIENGGCDETCHGSDGQLINLKSLYGIDLFTLANNDPWQVLHKIRFGQPGSVPFMQGLSPTQDQASNFKIATNTLSYIQVGLKREFVHSGGLHEVSQILFSSKEDE